MSHTRWDYASLIRDRGFRVTPQRQLILDAICAAHGHTTFEEIFARVKAKSSAVNRATVYRALDFLCKLRLVVAADLGNGRTVYEIAGDRPHHHLVCRACGATHELPHDVVAGLFARVAREHRFHVDMDHVALFGLCEACRAQAQPAAALKPVPARRRASLRKPRAGA
jgi:Fur family ferric uptake transcriptional regulator